MKPKTVSQYYTGFNEVAEDFLKLVRKHRDPNTNLLSDVPSHLFKWSFECKNHCLKLIMIKFIN